MDTKDSVIAYLPVGRDSLFDRTVYFSNTLVAEKHLFLAAPYIRDLSNGSAKYNDGSSRCFSPRVNGYIYRVTPMSEYDLIYDPALDRMRIPVLCHENGRTYISAAAAGRALGIKPSGINKVVHLERVSTGGYTFTRAPIFRLEDGTWGVHISDTQPNTLF